MLEEGISVNAELMEGAVVVAAGLAFVSSVCDVNIT
jgi:hypothetical protein